ncbi:hypothetical protein [Acetobacter syzygii]|uniref:hypothetical protein n=1 Tax=Acetobacter syzygii TaxID=146476 RepID=UPI0039ED3CB8
MTNWLARLRGCFGASTLHGGGVARTLTTHGGARREPVLPRTLQQTDHKTGRLGKKRSGLGAVFGWAVQAGGAAAYAPSTMQERADHLFQPYQPPRGVRGAGGSALAMDAALGAYAAGQYGMASSFVEQGLAFKGYPTLAAMMLRAEFRKPVEIIAREATRAWVRFRCNGVGADAAQTAARLRAVEAEFLRLHVRDVVRRQIVHGLGFGQHHMGAMAAPARTVGYAATGGAPCRALIWRSSRLCWCARCWRRSGWQGRPPYRW